ncbi:MAG: ferritin [Bacteroidales bacterium]|nr:ferritin [Bacteroidales bacterium]
MESSLNDTINAQINIELWSAYLFLSMSVNASSKGLKGVAHWFYIQHQKELSDAKKLIDHLDSINSKVYLYPIEGVPTEWDSPLEMFKHKLEHDKKISKSIHTTAIFAQEKEDQATIDFLAKFAKEQHKEENISRSMIMVFDAAQDDKDIISLLDKELGERKL